jgi:catechol 2,3-dioxygenase-like lactoylglutathione lyase family enzyme
MFRERAIVYNSNMRILAIDHVQLAMPPDEEQKARDFYTGVLGLDEIPKPESLARRGGLWFEKAALKIHLGVERDFRPAKKAHPALLIEGLEELISRCEQGGYEAVPGEAINGYRRVYVSDPFGNRIELMEAQEADRQ